MRRLLATSLIAGLGCAVAVRVSAHPSEVAQVDPQPDPYADYAEPQAEVAPGDAYVEEGDASGEPVPEVVDEVAVEAPPEPEPARAVYIEPGYEEPLPIAVRFVPPPMRYEPPPPPPGEGMFWVGGYWVWQDGEWAWMSGHWVVQRAGYEWQPPYYENRSGAVIFVTGHWRREGVRWTPPPPTMRVRMVEARPGYRASPPPQTQYGVFVPPPPGSRPGIIVPAPIGTSPQVVVSAPPVMRAGMVVRPHGVGGMRGGVNVTVFAPAGVTKSGHAMNSTVPTRPALAAGMPPRVAVAAPPPPRAVVTAHPNAFSPVAVHPPTPGHRMALPPTVVQQQRQSIQASRPVHAGRPGPQNGGPQGMPAGHGGSQPKQPKNSGMSGQSQPRGPQGTPPGHGGSQPAQPGMTGQSQPRGPQGMPAGHGAAAPSQSGSPRFVPPQRTGAVPGNRSGLGGQSGSGHPEARPGAGSEHAAQPGAAPSRERKSREEEERGRR